MALEFSGKDIMEEELIFLDEVLPKMEEQRRKIKLALSQLAAHKAQVLPSVPQSTWDELMEGYAREGIPYP